MADNTLQNNYWNNERTFKLSPDIVIEPTTNDGSLYIFWSSDADDDGGELTLRNC